jgi:CubicO group peptidase (beta-lactamase class C family)
MNRPAGVTANKREFSAMLLVCILLALATIATGQLHASIREVAARDIDEIFAPWDKPGSPGAALAILHDGRIVYERGYGRANLEHDIPITPETVFYVGSVSKQFAAAAVSLLARQGKLGLDNHVRKYVPELPGYADAITIRQLIHHTSGLRDYLELRSLAGEAPDDVFGDADVLALITKQKALNFSSGSEHLYSNSGYFLLSVIVKRVAGKTLRQFTAENIFEPLGMKSAQFRDDHARLIQKRADGYAPVAGGRFRLSNPNFDVVGAGGVFMAVRDFLAWDENFYQPKVGDQDWITALQTPGKLNHGAMLTYAFGLTVRSYRGVRLVEHAGAYGGFRAHAVRFPAHHFSIVCFTNLATMNPSQLSMRVASLYLADVMTAAATQAVPAAGGSSPGPAPANLAVSEIEALIGSYYSEELEVTFHIAKDGNGLSLRRGSNPGQKLSVVGKDSFRAGTIELTFQRGEGAIASTFRLDSGRVRGLIFSRR